jgi:hypothetical protein
VGYNCTIALKTSENKTESTFIPLQMCKRYFFRIISFFEVTNLSICTLVHGLIFYKQTLKQTSYRWQKKKQS